MRARVYVWGVFLTSLGVGSGWNTVRERWKINNRPRLNFPLIIILLIQLFLSKKTEEKGYFIKFSFLSKNCIDHEESRGRGFTFHEMIIFIRLSNFIYRFHFVYCHVDEQVSCNAPWQFSKQTTPSIHIVHNREYLSNAGEIKASLKITRQRSTMEDAFLESCTYILSRTFNHFYIRI